MLAQFSLIAHACRDIYPALVCRIESGDVDEALLQLEAILTGDPKPDEAHLVLLGRLKCHALMHLGRDVEADEAFQQQRRRTRDKTCASSRCESALDQGAQLLTRRRLGRAAQCATTVLDDPQAAPAQQLEALMLLSECLNELGEHAACVSALSAAHRLAPQDRHVEHLLNLVSIEQAVRCTTRPSRQGSPLSICLTASESAPYEPPAGPKLQVQLSTLSAQLTGKRLLFQRLAALRALVGAADGDADQAKTISDHVRWLYEHDLLGLAERLRLDAALACLRSNLNDMAARLLHPLIADESRVRLHRHAVTLHYCLAQLHMRAGRLEEALAAFNEHAVESARLLRTELVALRLPRALRTSSKPAALNADALRLPARYRSAYHFIIENITTRSLSVSDVAAEIGITPRMLQLAFKEHLGMSPAEFIREQRLQRIDAELQANPSSRQPRKQVALQWGLSKRAAHALSNEPEGHALPPSPLQNHVQHC